MTLTTIVNEDTAKTTASALTESDKSNNDKQNIDAIIKNAKLNSFIGDPITTKQIDLNKDVDKIRRDPTSKRLETSNLQKNNRFEHLPDITSLFTDSPINSENFFAGLETHNIRSVIRSSTLTKQSSLQTVHKEEIKPTRNAELEAHTIGPYESLDEDYPSDQSESKSSKHMQENLQKIQDDESSTVLPEAEPSYKYNIKVRNNGKVLDPALE